MRFTIVMNFSGKVNSKAHIISDTDIYLKLRLRVHHTKLGRNIAGFPYYVKKLSDSLEV